MGGGVRGGGMFRKQNRMTKIETPVGNHRRVCPWGEGRHKENQCLLA